MSSRDLGITFKISTWDGSVHLAVSGNAVFRSSSFTEHFRRAAEMSGFAVRKLKFKESSFFSRKPTPIAGGDNQERERKLFKCNSSLVPTL